MKHIAHITNQYNFKDNVVTLFTIDNNNSQKLQYLHDYLGTK